MVESIEFPQLANKYHVYGVPRTVINEETSVEGALPEEPFVAHVLKAVGLVTEEELAEMMEGLVAQVDDHEHGDGQDENGDES